MDRRDQDKKWQIDRHVPLAMILTFVSMFMANTVGVVWWAAKMDNRVATLESDKDAGRNADARLVKVEAAVARMPGIESDIGVIKDIVARIDERQRRGVQ